LTATAVARCGWPAWGRAAGTGDRWDSAGVRCDWGVFGSRAFVCWPEGDGVGRLPDCHSRTRRSRLANSWARQPRMRVFRALGSQLRSASAWVAARRLANWAARGCG